MTSRASVSPRLRGRGALPRREDRRHLGHLQVSRLPERYWWDRAGAAGWVGDGSTGPEPSREDLAVPPLL